MSVRILVGDCRAMLRTLEAQSVQMCVTSPPYFGLRDYGVDGQIGLEETPDDFVAQMVEVFCEVRRVLRDDGTLWLNLGDSYNNFRVSQCGQSVHGGEARGKPAGRRAVDSLLKEKDLIGIPWRVAFALQADGWYLRQDIIWSKPNPMPESVRDRCTKAHEYLFLLSKSPRYFYDADAISEPAVNAGTLCAPGGANKERTERQFATRPKNSIAVGDTRNKRSVWEVATQPFKEAHFATFPPALIEPCVLAGSREGDTILDPFGGAGTTGLVADRLNRNAILCELNPAYAEIARNRITGDSPLFAEVGT